MLLLSMYVLYSNVIYIYPVSCLVEMKNNQIVLFQERKEELEKEGDRQAS